MTPLEEYLNEARIKNTTFYLRELKKKFPLEKEIISKFKFLGIIQPMYNSEKYQSKYYKI